MVMSSFVDTSTYNDCFAVLPAHKSFFLPDERMKELLQLWKEEQDSLKQVERLHDTYYCEVTWKSKLAKIDFTSYEPIQKDNLKWLKGNLCEYIFFQFVVFYLRFVETNDPNVILIVYTSTVIQAKEMLERMKEESILKKETIAVQEIGQVIKNIDDELTTDNGKATKVRSKTLIYICKSNSGHRPDLD